MTFGARLRAARRARNLTQEDLGVLLGVSGATVSRWESGRDAPTFSLLPELSTRVLTSLDVLICGKPFQPGDSTLMVGEQQSEYAVSTTYARDPGEVALLLAYRELGDVKQRAVQMLIRPSREL